MKPRAWKTLGVVLAASMAGAVLVRAQTQMLSGSELVSALWHGGCVIVLRHASSPPEAPTKETANPDNAALERQLDQKGRDGAFAMGEALRTLRIPVGTVLSSPAYRAIETARTAQLGSVKTYAELGDGGQSMQGATDAQVAFLQKRVADLPARTNTVIVTHQPNIARAFPSVAADLTDGEALVFGTDGKGGSILIGRVKIEDWPHLQR
jgi:phosphohistidine phosphatase SixA